MTTNQDMLNRAQINRAQGCLLGQVAGDSLGSLVEFQTPEQIYKTYPNGVRLLADGGTFNTIAGQPTDDSEMAILLARSLIRERGFKQSAVRNAYVYWLDSKPFDCGLTIMQGLTGAPNSDSQANGAMMRISPLGIYGANFNQEQVELWAKEDARLTHPHEICVQANALFTGAISLAVRTGIGASDLYAHIVKRAKELHVNTKLMDIIIEAEQYCPADYVHQEGWVFIAFQNALYQLNKGRTFEDALINTVKRGGDTDTNAAICGALLGAVYGVDAVPQQWKTSVLNCRPKHGDPRVKRPRPESMWPVDIMELAERLLRMK